MREFNYSSPTSLAEARAAFNASDDALYLSGGHTLIPAMKQRLIAPDDVIDLAAVPGLSDIAVEGQMLRVGALCAHAEVAASAVVQSSIPGLASLAGAIGDAQVRRRGTIGGSVANSDPAADYPAAVLALDAVIETDERQHSADGFFTGMFETTVGAGEIITAVSFKVPQKAAYAKFPNPASRYAMVGVFVARFTDGYRVGVTGAAVSAFRWTALESALNADASAGAAGVALDGAEFNEDLHATAEYRAHLVAVMADRALAEIRA
mgnify:CR=1 FL=1|jgi:carbon-monoxide dehydrogenase medium subunit